MEKTDIFTAVNFTNLRRYLHKTRQKQVNQKAGAWECRKEAVVLPTMSLAEALRFRRPRMIERKKQLF